MGRTNVRKIISVLIMGPICFLDCANRCLDAVMRDQEQTIRPMLLFIAVLSIMALAGWLWQLSVCHGLAHPVTSNPPMETQKSSHRPRRHFISAEEFNQLLR